MTFGIGGRAILGLRKLDFQTSVLLSDRNLQNWYYMPNPNSPKAFFGRHWVFVCNIFGGVHTDWFRP